MKPVIPLEDSFDAVLGVEYERPGDGTVAATIPVRRHLLQPYGLVHGGVYAAIAESLASAGTAFGVAADGKIALGEQNDTSFLRPISSGSIHASARALHRGRTRWIWDVEMRDDEGRLCAVTRMTVAVRAPG
ncbi:MAG TPA: PaaI family thioesterase [Acidimicrobiales bacterium]|nr:PaaI family thioesterase [Acidimicrobiales bacterium]